MAVDRTYTLVSIAWNGETLNKNNGGPLGVHFSHSARAILDRTADDVYSPCVITPEKDINFSFRVRDISLLWVPNEDKDDAVLTVKKAGRPDTTYTITFKDMVLVDIDSSLQRSIPGEGSLVFAHEHVTDTIVKA